MTEETKAKNKTIYDALKKGTQQNRIRKMLKHAIDAALHSDSFVIDKPSGETDAVVEITVVIRDKWNIDEIKSAIMDVLPGLPEHFKLQPICVNIIDVPLELDIDSEYTIVNIRAHGDIPFDIDQECVEKTRDNIYRSITNAIHQEMFVKQRFVFDDEHTTFEMNFNIELLGSKILLYRMGLSWSIEWYICHNMIPYQAFIVDTNAYFINGRLVGNLVIKRK